MLAAVCFSFVGIAYRLILDEFDISPIAVVAIRASTSAIVLFAVIALRPKLRAQLPVAFSRDVRWTLLIAGIGSSAGFYIALIYAFEIAGVAVGTVLLYLAPSMVAVALWVVYRERLSRSQTLALGLSFAGVIGVSGLLTDGDNVRPLGIALGVISAASYAAYSLLGQKLLQRLDPLVVVALTAGIGALAMWTVKFIVHGSGLPSLAAVLWIVGTTGFVATLLPQVLYTWGLAQLGAGRASLLTTIEPVAAAALAFVILGETLSLLQIGGGSLVIVGVIVAGLDRTRL